MASDAAPLFTPHRSADGRRRLQVLGEGSPRRFGRTLQARLEPEEVRSHRDLGQRVLSGAGSRGPRGVCHGVMPVVRRSLRTGAVSVSAATSGAAASSVGANAAGAIAPCRIYRMLDLRVTGLRWGMQELFGSAAGVDRVFVMAHRDLVGVLRLPRFLVPGKVGAWRHPSWNLRRGLYEGDGRATRSMRARRPVVRAWV